MSSVIVNVKRPDLLTFTMPFVAVFGAMFGFVTGNIFGDPWIGLVGGAVVGAGLAAILAQITKINRRAKILGIALIFGLAGAIFGGLGGFLGGFLVGVSMGWFATWVGTGKYRAGVPTYYTPGQVLWHNTFLFICAFVFFFLIAPLIPVVWLSFNAEKSFTFNARNPELQGKRLKPEALPRFPGYDRVVGVA